jgi:alkanesulfonate monooxygenase SsuD/methylene tetrahydromethanopterin reductase-like flavin-dependent oxidoreductase (luciferase family)
MWIAARDPNTHAFAVASGCNIQVTPLALGDDEVANLMGKVNTACAEHPEMPRPEVMLLMHAYVSESEDELAQAARNIEEFYHYFAKLFRNSTPMVDGFIEPVTDDDRALNPQYAAEVMRRNMLIGTPDEVIERLRSYQELGYAEFSIWLDGHMDYQQKSRNLQLFTNKVIPAFAG